LCHYGVISSSVPRIARQGGASSDQDSTWLAGGGEVGATPEQANHLSGSGEARWWGMLGA